MITLVSDQGDPPAVAEPHLGDDPIWTEVAMISNVPP
jgi:hypothetical protein